MLASDPVASQGPLDDLERCRVFRPLIDHLVDNAPLHCHFPSQEVVALERVLDLLERLAGVLHVDLVETLLEIQDLVGMKHEVGRLALEAAGRLMRKQRARCATRRSMRKAKRSNKLGLRSARRKSAFERGAAFPQNCLLTPGLRGRKARGGGGLG